MAKEDDGDIELRGMCPRLIVDVLDAVSKSKRINRNELVIRILNSWVQEKLSEHTLIQRLTRGNGITPESGWGSLE